MTRPSRHRRAASTLIATGVAAVTAAGTAQLLGGSAAGAGPIIFPWPQCAPLCAHGPGHGPRFTAVYVSTQQRRGRRPVVTVDAFAAGIPRRSLTGELCYESQHSAREPGCIVTATTHGRRVGAGVWWLRFRARVYERYEIVVGGNSHALVRTYWLGVSAAGTEGARHGIFHIAGR